MTLTPDQLAATVVRSHWPTYRDAAANEPFIVECSCGWKSTRDRPVVEWKDHFTDMLRPHVVAREKVEHVEETINEYAAEALQRGGVIGNSEAAAHAADLNLLRALLAGDNDGDE